MDINSIFGETAEVGAGWGALFEDEPRRSNKFEDCPVAGTGLSFPMLMRSTGYFLAGGEGSQATSKISTSAGFFGFSSTFTWGGGFEGFFSN